MRLLYGSAGCECPKAAATAARRRQDVPGPDVLKPRWAEVKSNCIYSDGTNGFILKTILDQCYLNMAQSGSVPTHSLAHRCGQLPRVERAFARACSGGALRV